MASHDHVTDHEVALYCVDGTPEVNIGANRTDFGVTFTILSHMSHCPEKKSFYHDFFCHR